MPVLPLSLSQSPQLLPDSGPGRGAVIHIHAHTEHRQSVFLPDAQEPPSQGVFDCDRTGHQNLYRSPPHSDTRMCLHIYVTGRCIVSHWLLG